MREIKFRGQRCKDGKWVYGSYVESNKSWAGHKPHKSWILPSPMTNGGWFSINGSYPVKEETVGQFTGLHDKNDKEIYEGDIVRWQYPCRDSDTGWNGWSNSQLCEVKFEYGAFYIDEYPYVLGKTLDFDDGEDWRLEVIGNIHEKEYQDEQ